MAGAAQASRAGRDPRRRPARPGSDRRRRPVRRDPVGRLVVEIEVVPVNVRDADEIERAATAFARTAGGGLVVTASAWHWST